MRLPARRIPTSPPNTVAWRGKKRALVSVAHSLLVAAYDMLQRKERYRELGADYFDQRRPEASAKRLVKRLQQLGYQVDLQPAAPPPA